MLINRPHLARIGHNHLPPQPLQVSTDPWTVRSGFHHGQCPTVTGSQSGQGSSIVAQSSFLDHSAFAIEHTKPVPALSQIQSYRELTPIALFLHKTQSLPPRALALRLSSPSHLIWLGVDVAGTQALHPLIRPTREMIVKPRPDVLGRPHSSALEPETLIASGGCLVGSLVQRERSRD